MRGSRHAAEFHGEIQFKIYLNKLIQVLSRALQANYRQFRRRLQGGGWSHLLVRRFQRTGKPKRPFEKDRLDAEMKVRIFLLLLFSVPAG